MSKKPTAFVCILSSRFASSFFFISVVDFAWPGNIGLRFAQNDTVMTQIISRSLDSFRSQFLYENSLHPLLVFSHIAYILFVSVFLHCRRIWLTICRGRGRECTGEGGRGHPSPTGRRTNRGQEKIRDKSLRLRGITSRTFILKVLLLKII